MDNKDLVVSLTIVGSEYEEVEVLVTDPNKTIRDQINSIITVFELPKIDYEGNPIKYLLGKIMGDDIEPESLEFEDSEGREQSFVDYKIKPGDKLELSSVPLYG